MMNTMSTSEIDIQLNGEPRRVPTAATLADVIAGLHLPHRAYAVEVNQRLIPRREHETHRLQPGDAVEVVTLVGGG